MEKIEMEFPHLDKKLTASYPFFGPVNSKTLLSIIKQEQYTEPTFPELTSFIHHYFGKEGPQSKKIREVMNTKYFVGFTGILYLPRKNEVCFFDRPSFHRDSVVDADNLLGRIKFNEDYIKISMDSSEAGSVPWNKISKNRYFIAVGGGEEGAEKLAELASMHPDKKGHIFVPDISNFTTPQARIALLYSYGEGKSLTVSLNGSGYSTNSYSFGLI